MNLHGNFDLNQIHDIHSFINPFNITYKAPLLPSSTLSPFYNNCHKSVPSSLITPSNSEKKRKRWTPIEILALESGMKEYGTNWAGILADDRFSQVLNSRTQMQCKDKAAVEKERRIKDCLREGKVACDDELGVWQYAWFILLILAKERE